ncbi:MAG: hypothetical protein KTQ49_07330 [Candidatus Omnitrophica bacterium]|nr:hypothetical protein [Candidatus Omnitrophota bacterium]
MKKQRRKVRGGSRSGSIGPKDVLAFYSELAAIKKELRMTGEAQTNSQKRLLDIEIHLNLLTRLLTTLCIEKFGMKVLTFKRLIRRIEKEASRDSQILELESLYSLTDPGVKKTSGPHKRKEDPWDQIS